jgi:hypothetical protein
MYGVVRQYSADPKNLHEIFRRKIEGGVPIIQAIPGLVTYTLVNGSHGAFLSAGLFDDKAGADESTMRAAAWVKDNLASMLPTPPTIMAGEIRVRVNTREPWFGVLRKYRVEPRHVSTLTERVREEFLPMVSALPDFATYALLDAGGGTMVTLSGFVTAKGAAESSRVASEWVKNRLTSLVPAPPEVAYGEVRHRVIVK